MSPFGSNFHHDSFEWIGPPPKRWDPPTSLNYRSNTSINIDFNGLGNGIKSAAKWGFLGNVLNNITNLSTVWMLSKGNEKGAAMLQTGLGMAGSIFGGGFGFGGNYGGYGGYGMGYGGGFGGSLAHPPYTYVDYSRFPTIGGGVPIGGNSRVENGNDGKKVENGNDGKKVENGNDGKKVENGNDGKKVENSDDGKKVENSNGGKKVENSNGGEKVENSNGNGNGGNNNFSPEGFIEAINGDKEAVATNPKATVDKTIDGKIELGAQVKNQGSNHMKTHASGYPNSFTITDTGTGHSNKYVFEFDRLEEIGGQEKPVYIVKNNKDDGHDTNSGVTETSYTNCIYETEYVLTSYNGGKIKLDAFNPGGSSFSN